MKNPIRLQKFLSQAGVASRRKSEEMIKSGEVFVNGVRADIGLVIDAEKDSVKISGKRIRVPRQQFQYLLLNKPQRVICTASDPEKRKTIFELTGLSPKRFFSVGRLDYQSEGAILLTNDGALCHQLTHPSFQIPKMYRVKVKGKCNEDRMKKLASGVTLEDGKTAPSDVEFVKDTDQGAWIKLTITEGRNRQVRRMVEKVKLRVSRLKRESFAGISVRGLRPGEFRMLTHLEKEHLFRLASH
ncbi:MAG TPA: pseudouridine synthase [Bdellovibrionota bacterium]|nr:pseudouridine synthase [Bdellovibrionota bacterium]